MSPHRGLHSCEAGMCDEGNEDKVSRRRMNRYYTVGGSKSNEHIPNPRPKTRDLLESLST